MKKQIMLCFLIGSLSGFAQENTKKGIDAGIIINENYSKAAKIDSILKSFAPEILPGASVAVYSEAEGWWAGAAGYADLKNKIPMRNDHLQYLQSVSKMYVAVEILQLKEAGKIELDQPMTKYLPKKYSKFITGAETITVRMLLNHTSGIPEYNENVDFLSYALLHPLKNFSSEDCLKAVEGKPLMWKPGSKYKYANTNYLLLSLIGDALTGDHAAYIKKHIFEPLGLKNTFYGKGHDYLKGLNVPKTYWDVWNNGIAVDISAFQEMTVVCSKGDDGIVCTTTDAVLFLKSLFEGKLLQQESMTEMINFVKDENGHNRYGMGMIYFDLGGLPAYGHGGGGVGAGCGLLYIPSHKTYIFFSTNIAVLPEGKTPEKAGELRNALLAAILQ